MRQPPEKTPVKFKPGDLMNVFGLSGVWRITEVNLMTKEWLVRTAYAAGFYHYSLVLPEDPREILERVSENTLTLAVIEQLGKIAEEKQ